jgi:tetratricopeptide (TPR) repeat protein
MNTTIPAAGTLEALRHRAQQCMDEGQPSAALGALEVVVRQVPDDVDARLDMSRLLLQGGRLRDATKMLLETRSQHMPDDAFKIANLAQLLTMVGETVAARDCLAHPATEHTGSPGALVVMAHARHQLGEPAAALANMDRALAAGVDHPYNHHFHSLLLQFVGRLQEAEIELDACLRRWPTFGRAALTRSRLRRQTLATQHLDFLRGQLHKVPTDGVEHACFQFALFKELDDLGRYDEAWPALRRANAIMRARNPYNGLDDARLVEATIEYVNADVCNVRASEPGDEGPMPIFIVGMPRSGTTLLEQMLSGHSRVSPAGELRDFFCQWRQVAAVDQGTPCDMLNALRHCADLDFRQLGERYLRQTRWRAKGGDWYIDKMPNNFEFVGIIHRALPQAPILNIVRDPMAVCFSNFKAMLGDASAHCYDLGELARFHGRHTRLYRHWHTAVPGAMLDVSYESLVQAPQATMWRVLEHCGLVPEENCLHPSRNKTPVSTPSSAQVREPIHTRGLDEWQHYATHLRPLQDALAVELSRS